MNILYYKSYFSEKKNFQFHCLKCFFFNSKQLFSDCGLPSLSHYSVQMGSCKQPVVSILQPDFVAKLQKKDCKPNFSIKTFDNEDVFHVRIVEGAASNNQVTFKLFENLPDDKDKADKIAAEMISSLDQSDTLQAAFLVGPKEEQVLAYVTISSSEPLRRAIVLCQPSKSLLYSRSKGILESKVLENCKVAVVGLGSGGSHVAIELAKAGVGNFVLVDFDRIELNNIIRHVCGLSDLGRLKTDAIRERILDKNPFANIVCRNTNINNIQEAREMFKGCDLIIAATDNIRSRLNINDLSLELNITTIYGKCSARAAGGEVLRVRPHDGPCFCCVYTQAMVEASTEEMTNFRQAREANPIYVSDSEVEAMIQVGLSSDILPISNMIVKIALVELTKGKKSGLSGLEQDFQAAYYTWANRREQLYAGFPVDGFLRFDQPSILRWYSSQMERKADCKSCQEIEDGNASFFSKQ